jgi:hypothetical protein
MRSTEGFVRKEISRGEQKHRSAGNLFSSFRSVGISMGQRLERVKEVEISCSNNPNISSDGSSSADRFEFMFLQNS